MGLEDAACECYATLKERADPMTAIAVALDAGSGAELWRTPMTLADENT